MVQNQFGLTVQRVRSDNGTKFTNGPLQNYFLEQGIIHFPSIQVRIFKKPDDPWKEVHAHTTLNF